MSFFSTLAALNNHLRFVAIIMKNEQHLASSNLLVSLMSFPCKCRGNIRLFPVVSAFDSYLFSQSCFATSSCSVTSGYSSTRRISPPYNLNESKAKITPFSFSHACTRTYTHTDSLSLLVFHEISNDDGRQFLPYLVDQKSTAHHTSVALIVPCMEKDRHTY